MDFRSVEVRFARRQADNVPSFGFQLLGQIVHGDRGGRLDSPQRVGEAQFGHDFSNWAGVKNQDGGGSARLKRRGP